jgi:MoaA/NifB/PqqE/SkfB family radical SAM enzyme
MSSLNHDAYHDDVVRITLIDPITLDNYDLYFRLYSMSLARKWVKEMKAIKKHSFSFREKKIHHSNFEITAPFINDLNKNIKKINEFYDVRLKYPITEITQDILNELHDSYAVYGVRNQEKLEAKWWDTAHEIYDKSHFYAQRWPGINFNEDMHQAFIKLNDLIHTAEFALARGNISVNEFVGVASYNPRKNIDLTDEDIYCLKTFSDFGDLCLGYNTLGKSLKHVITDGDLDSLKRKLIFPQTTWSNEIFFHMRPSENNPLAYKHHYDQWKKLNPEQFGYNYGDFHKNREGYYVIGTLAPQQKADIWDLCNETLKIDLSRFTDIFDISIISSAHFYAEYNMPENRKPTWKKLAPEQGKKITSIENNSFSQVTWILNDICNYSCRYCPPSLHNGKNYPISWEQVEPFVNHSIELLSENDRKIIFSISGGEPTLSPFFSELVKEIHNKGHYTVLTTNLARTTRYIEENFKYLLQASCSFHPAFEFTNKTSDAFIEKLQVSSKVTDTSVRVMMDPLYWDQCVEFIEKVNANTNVKIEIVAIEDQYGNSSEKLCEINYTPEQLEFFKNFKPIQTSSRENYLVKKLNRASLITYEDGTTDYGISYQKLINNGQTRFYGWNCAIGKESMFIHQTGHIRKANCHVGGQTLGHIDNWQKINWIDFKKEIVCTQRTCTCGADVPITKYLEK